MGTDPWQPADLVDGLFTRINLQAREAMEAAAFRAQNVDKADEGGFFGTENWVLNQMGPSGGLLLMAIAVIWFVVGWMNGYIYYYPPILFVVGFIGIFRS